MAFAEGTDIRMTGDRKRAAVWGTVLVLVHLLINFVHAAAHVQLSIDLSAAQMAFVVAVIMVCPLIAMGLLWTTRARIGLALLAASMAGALLFGAYNHLYAPGSDHVGTHGPGFWPAAFTWSAYGLAAAEACGAYLALHFLFRESPGPHARI
jgi:hypothetical protein